MIYYLIYIPFILCGAIDSDEISKRNKKVICLFWVGVLTLFWGLRWRCGTDWYQFHDDFYLLNFKNMFSFDRGMNEKLEPGYSLLNALFHEAGLNYTVFLICFSFTILFSFAKFCLDNSRYPIMSFVYLVISMGVIFPSRQMLAVAVVLLGTKYVFKPGMNSFLKYALFVLAASTIHTSAIIAIVVYLFPRIKLQYKTIGVILILVVSLMSLLPMFVEYLTKIFDRFSLISVRLTSYSQIVSSVNENFSARSVMSYFLTAFFLVSFLINKYNEANDIKVRSSFNGYLTQESIRYLFAESMRDLMRLEAYFHPFSAILISNLLSEGYSKKMFILWKAMFVILMIYFLNKMLFGIFSDLYFPYRSVL